jgi:hypothetical protein
MTDKLFSYTIVAAVLLGIGGVVVHKQVTSTCTAETCHTLTVRRIQAGVVVAASAANSEFGELERQ